MKKIFKTGQTSFFALFLVLAIGLVGPVFAQDPASFYKGKTLNWVVSSGPSSTTTLLSRLAAKYLGEEIGARVRVENQGRNKGLNFVYAKAKPDGLTIVSKAKTAVLFNDLANAPGIQYKSSKYIYLTDLMPDIGALFVKTDSPLKSLSDLRNAKGLKAGGTSAKGFLATSAAILYEIIGIDGKVVPGYKSPPKVILALAQGEVDLMALQAAAVLKDVKNGRVRPLFVVAPKRFGAMPDIPTLEEFGVPIPAQWESALDLISNTGQAVMAPPGVPKERIDFLRSTFQKIAKNPEVQKGVEKITGYWSPFGDGAKMQKDIVKIMSDQELRNQLKAVVGKYSAAAK
jgi:tripartite-type tricarboxylate transporter receptor subunit TctC